MKPLLILITLRVDFIGRCGELLLDNQGTRLDRVAYDEAHRVFVAQMSPEQLQDAKRVGTSSDLWSLSAALFEALSGCRPLPR